MFKLSEELRSSLMDFFKTHSIKRFDTADNWGYFCPFCNSKEIGSNNIKHCEDCHSMILLQKLEDLKLYFEPIKEISEYKFLYTERFSYLTRDLFFKYHSQDEWNSFSNFIRAKPFYFINGKIAILSQSYKAWLKERRNNGQP